MKKILPILPAVLFLLLVLPGSVSAASTINISDVISTSQANGSPLGVCIGPDKKHLQTTREVCETLNKAWGKGSGSFSIGVPNPPSTPAVNVAVATAKNGNSPTGDCIGPDKKHLQATKEVCEAFNKAWGRSNVAFTAGVSVSSTSQSVAELISIAQNTDLPKGDCIGPDKKHLETTKEVCDAFNHAWGKTAAPFNPSVSASTTNAGGSTGGSGSSGSGSSSSGSSGSSGSSAVSSGGSSSGSSTSETSDKTKDKDKDKSKSK